MGAEHKIDDAMSRDEKRYYAKENEAKVPYLHTYLLSIKSLLLSQSEIVAVFLYSYIHTITLSFIFSIVGEENEEEGNDSFDQYGDVGGED